jgi:hypothetical protein
MMCRQRRRDELVQVQQRISKCMLHACARITSAHPFVPLSLMPPYMFTP